MSAPASGEWTFGDLSVDANVDREAYHDPARDRLSWSRLKLFMSGADGRQPPPAGGAADYHAIYVSRTREREPATPAMLVGQAVDRLREVYDGDGVIPSALRAGIIPAPPGAAGVRQAEVARKVIQWWRDGGSSTWCFQRTSVVGDVFMAPDPKLVGVCSIPYGPRAKAYQEAAAVAVAQGLDAVTADDWNAGLELAQGLVKYNELPEDPFLGGTEDPEIRNGRLLVLPDELWIEARRCFGALANPKTVKAKMAHRLLFEYPGVTEGTILWDDLAFGGGDAPGWYRPENIPCQARIDRLAIVAGHPVLVDVKTASDPSPSEGRRYAGFDLAARRYDYAGQAAFYRRGFARAHEVDQKPEVFLVVLGKGDEPRIDVRSIDQETLDAADRRIDQSLDELAERLEDRIPWTASWEEDRTLTPISY